MTALGFASGLPFLLSNATLAYWLTYDHVNLALIGLTANAGLPYLLKFLWAPVFDEIKPLFLSHRRGWLITVQIPLILTIAALAMSDPEKHIWQVLGIATLIAFFSASQDILIDAWRIEFFALRAQGAALAAEIWGYRAALLVAGSGVIYLSKIIGWNEVILLIAALACVGPAAAWLAPEPEVTRLEDSGRFTRRLAQAVWTPLQEFLMRRGALVVIAFILCFRLGEALAGVMLPPYYVHLGFNQRAIAQAIGPASLMASLAGAALGGALVARIGVGRTLLVATLFQTLVLGMYPALGLFAGHPGMLVATSVVESFAGTFAMSAFLTYLSGLCDPAYTATQYALLSSLSPVALHTIGGFSGLLAARMGFMPFFVMTTIAALPAMALTLVILRFYPPADRRGMDGGGVLAS